MPTPQSFKVPLNEWRILEPNSSKEMLWINETVPDIMVQRFALKAPDDLPADYPDIHSQRAMFETMITQADGAVVSVDFLTVKGIEAFQTIFKFRMPSNALGKRYLGTLMFPFENFFCGFSFQCDEYGTTGIRESIAYVSETRGKKPEHDPNAPPPTILNSMEEFFDRVKQSPVVRLPSDDEKYDAALPRHPLSRTRQYLKKIAETIEFDEEVRNAKPYRGIQKRSGNMNFRNTL